MKRFLFLLLAILTTALLALTVAGNAWSLSQAAGDPDPTFAGFDGDGIRTIGGISVTAVALDQNGRLLVAGRSGSDLLLERFESNGARDFSFGNAGTVRLRDAALFPHPVQVAVQPNGRIVVASSVDNGNSDRDFFVARLHGDGSPDLGFGLNGVAVTDFDGKDDFPDAGIVIQNDGKIVVAGSAVNERSLNFDEPDFAVVRYQTNGALDASFDDDGKVLVDFDGYIRSDSAYDVFLQPDGKIVLGGAADNSSVAPPSGGDEFGLARLNPDGSLDSLFDGDGRLFADLGANLERINALRYLPDGRILAVGESDTCSDQRVALARFLPNGEPDSSLDGDGKLSFEIGNAGSAARDAWVQPDGKVLLLVEVDPCGEPFPMLARLLPGGALDSSFDGDGLLSLASDAGAAGLIMQPDGKLLVATRNALQRLLPNFEPDQAGQTVTNFGAAEDDEAHAILLQPDGKVLVVGTGAAQPGARDVALARYHPHGAPDTSFSQDGLAYFATNLDEYGRDMALQPDGKIVVAGSNVPADHDFAVFRLNSDGTHDSSFNVVGYRFADFGEGDDEAQAVALLPDGKILLGGHAANGASAGDNDFALLRLKPDGRTDFSFGNNGLVRTTIGSGTVQARDMLLLDDGRIVLGGVHNSNGPGSGEFVLAAYLPDGTPDLSFGPDGTGIVEMGFADAFGNATYDSIEALALLPGGQILVTGTSGADWATIIFEDNGAPANYGVLWPIRTGWGMAAAPAAVALQDDGKVVIVGGAQNSVQSSSQFLVARYLFAPFNVRLDSGFGDGGKVMTPIQEGARAFGVASADNRIYVAGSSDNGQNLDVALASYLTGDVAPPPPSGEQAIYLPTLLNGATAN